MQMYIESEVKKEQLLAILLYVSDNSMVMLTCSVVDVGGGERGDLTVSQ